MKNIDKMTDVELVDYMGFDHEKWAEVFMNLIVKRNKRIDQRLMEAYFANALKSGYNCRNNQNIPLTNLDNDKNDLYYNKYDKGGEEMLAQYRNALDPFRRN